ncbi:MAG: peptidoglycan-binding protein [Patescibacteria group bacterium]|jgi:peptidoglycan hydrolase-like protein with peptidoglycan-binding domain
MMFRPVFYKEITSTKNNWRLLFALVVFCVVAFSNPRSIFAADTFLDGSLWRASGENTIYAIQKNHKRHITSPSVLSSYGWSFADVYIAKDATALQNLPNVRVVKTSESPTVYDVSSGYRVAIVSENNFLAAGYRWDEVVLINETELNTYPLPVLSVPAEPVAGSTKPVVSTIAAEQELPLIVKKIVEARALLHTAPLLYPQEKRIAWTRSLTKGESGADVKLLQETLQRLGYFSKNTTANGTFGPATYASVVAFQKAEGLDPVGIVGKQTQAALDRHGVSVSSGGKIVRSWQDTVPADRDVLLAVWNEKKNELKTVRVTLVTNGASRATPKVISKTPGFTVAYDGGNGVNVQYEVLAPAGYQVLANRFPIFDVAPGKTGTFPPAEEIYVPYNASFLDDAIVASGRAYLDKVVELALNDLRTKQIPSVSGKGLVADLVDPGVLKTIALIEHIDTSEFVTTSDKSRVVNKVFAILATNREDSYRFAGSSAGALGLAQFIKKTYASMVSRYPAAHLVPDFQKGMRDHVNAFKAMALYTDLNQTTLESYAASSITNDPVLLSTTMKEVLAAAYNGGATRIRTAIKKFGNDWQIASSSAYGLRAETKSYLKKFRAVNEWLTVS